MYPVLFPDRIFQKRKMLKKFLWQCFRCFQSTYHRDQHPADGGFVIHHYLSLLVTTCHYLSSITTFRTRTEFTTLFLLGLFIDIKIGKTMTTINWLGSDWNDPWKVLGLQPWSLHNDVDTLYPIFQQELRQNIIVVMLGKDNFYRDEDASWWHHIWASGQKQREIFCPLKESGCRGFDSGLDSEHHIFIWWSSCQHIFQFSLSYFHMMIVLGWLWTILKEKNIFCD